MHTQRGLDRILNSKQNTDDYIESPIGVTVIVGKTAERRLAHLDLSQPTEDIDAALAFIREQERCGLSLPLYLLAPGKWGIGERWSDKGTLARVARCF